MPPQPIIVKLAPQPNRRLYTAQPKRKTWWASLKVWESWYLAWGESKRSRLSEYHREEYFFNRRHRLKIGSDHYARNREEGRAEHRAYYNLKTYGEASTAYRIHKWTEEDEAYLALMYGLIPARLIAEKLGVKTKDIQERARRRGLKGKTGRPDESPARLLGVGEAWEYKGRNPSSEASRASKKYAPWVFKVERCMDGKILIRRTA